MQEAANTGLNVQPNGFFWVVSCATGFTEVWVETENGSNMGP